MAAVWFRLQAAQGGQCNRLRRWQASVWGSSLRAPLVPQLQMQMITAGKAVCRAPGAASSGVAVRLCRLLAAQALGQTMRQVQMLLVWVVAARAQAGKVVHCFPRQSGQRGMLRLWQMGASTGAGVQGGLCVAVRLLAVWEGQAGQGAQVCWVLQVTA